MTVKTLKRLTSAAAAALAFNFTLAAAAFAEEPDSAAIARSVFQQTYQPTATSSTATAVKETNGTAATTPGKISINPSAAQGAASQGAGAGANSAAGQALMSAGAALMSSPPTKPAGIALMAMGVLAMMQSAHDKAAKGASTATFDASSVDPGTNTPAADAEGASSFSSQAVKDATKTLADNGYTVTAAGVKNPDGSFTPASAFSSPSSMAAAGMDPNAVKEAGKVTAALNDEISKLNSKMGAGLAVGGGGGGGEGSNGNMPENDRLTLSPFSNPFAMNADARKKMMEGKTVLYDGQPIGVRGGNIFEMVHVAYEKKRSGNYFIEGESASRGGLQPASVRAPASARSFGAPASARSVGAPASARSVGAPASNIKRK